MKFTSANRLLRNAEPEALGGGAGAAVLPISAAAAAPAVVAVAEAPAAAASPAVAAVEPSLLEQVKAGLQSKGKLLSERDAAELRATKAEGDLATAKTELATLRSENATLKSERADIAAALTTAKAEKQDVDTAAASQVAAMGFDSAKLPAASNESAETVESLRAQIEKETDNNKLWALTERLEALLAGSN